MVKFSHPAPHHSVTAGTQSAIRMENETAKDAKNAENEGHFLSVLSVFSAVKSAIRNPQSAIAVDST